LSGVWSQPKVLTLAAYCDMNNTHSINSLFRRLVGPGVHLASPYRIGYGRR